MTYSSSSPSSSLSESCSSSSLLLVDSGSSSLNTRIGRLFPKMKDRCLIELRCCRPLKALIHSEEVRRQCPLRASPRCVHRWSLLFCNGFVSCRVHVMPDGTRHTASRSLPGTRVLRPFSDLGGNRLRTWSVGVSVTKSRPYITAHEQHLEGWPTICDSKPVFNHQYTAYTMLFCEY